MQHNERGIEMMSWLPWYYGDSRIMNEIIGAQSNEIVDIRAAILHILAQFYVDTADESGVEMWEKELALTPKEDASLELRKAQIKAKLQRPPIMTPLQIQSIVNLFVKGRTATVEECPGTYHFRIDIPFGDLMWRAEMFEAVDDAKPAHLGFHLRYTLINHELEEDIEIGDDTDNADFSAAPAIRYEDIVPYGNGLTAAKYDGSLQYGGGQVSHNGKFSFDGTAPFSGFLPEAPKFGKELQYHFRYCGRSNFDRSYQCDGSICYTGERPYRIEYDDSIDELGVLTITLARTGGKPIFEDNVDTCLSFDGLSHCDGSAAHGASPSPIDVGGDVSIKKFRRFDGRIDYTGGDINLFDGSMRYGNGFDFNGGGNQHAIKMYKDGLDGALELIRPKKFEPIVNRYPEIEDDIKVSDEQLNVIQLEPMEDTLETHVCYDRKVRYDSISTLSGITNAPLDEGGDIIITRLRKFDWSIPFSGGSIRYANGAIEYDGRHDFAGGGNKYEIKRIIDLISGEIPYKRR